MKVTIEIDDELFKLYEWYCKIINSNTKREMVRNVIADLESNINFTTYSIQIYRKDRLVPIPKRFHNIVKNLQKRSMNDEGEEGILHKKKGSRETKLEVDNKARGHPTY